jgi:hypothetical protein
MPLNSVHKIVHSLFVYAYKRHKWEECGPQCGVKYLHAKATRQQFLSERHKNLFTSPPLLRLLWTSNLLRIASVSTWLISVTHYGSYEDSFPLSAALLPISLSIYFTNPECFLSLRSSIWAQISKHRVCSGCGSEQVMVGCILVESRWAKDCTFLVSNSDAGYIDHLLHLGPKKLVNMI